MKNQKLNYRQARWVLYLSRFYFEMKHILETSMRMVDSLSRQLNWQDGIENNNKKQTLLKPEQFEARAMKKKKKEKVIIDSGHIRKNEKFRS